MNELHFMLILNFNKWGEFNVHVQIPAMIKFCVSMPRLFASFSPYISCLSSVLISSVSLLNPIAVLYG